MWRTPGDLVYSDFMETPKESEEVEEVIDPEEVLVPPDPEEEYGIEVTDPSKKRRFVSDKPTIDEIRRLKKPNTRKCVILLDSSLAHQMNDLEAQIEALSKRREGTRLSLADTTEKEIEELLVKLEILEDQAEELTVEFTFQDIGRRNYDDLVHAHVPSADEKEEYKEAGGDGVLAYSTETFPPALVNATAIEPKISIESATEIFEEWAEGDLEMIFSTALLVCKEPTSLPKSRAGIAKIRGSKRNSTTAPDKESPTPNS